MPNITTKDKTIPVDTDALRMVGSLFLLARTLDQRLRQEEAEDQLTVAEITVLAQVNRGNDLPSGIARSMRIDPGRVTRLTDRLVALSYLLRDSDPADRRRCVLRLTEAGATRLEQGKADISTAMMSILKGLPEGERAGLTRGLESARLLVDAKE